MPLLFLEICACSGYSGNGQLLKKFFRDKKPVAPPTALSKMTTRVSALKIHAGSSETALFSIQSSSM